uniref:collagen alpha-1(XXIII) chain-like n=1 Tax=Callithrix jacchus TaxID=9483 RepID=UPI0023DD52EE|nr:collagen alpha-1(XXIII) chain-like [Callithrix jacchus]
MSPPPTRLSDPRRGCNAFCAAGLPGSANYAEAARCGLRAQGWSETKNICVCLASLCLVNRHSFGAREWRWHGQIPGSSARPGQLAGGGAGPGAPRGLRAHAPHLGEAGRAGAQRGDSGLVLKPRAGKSWTVPGPLRAELSPAPPPPPRPPPLGLQQIAGERLREACAAPRDRSQHRSVSNSFPAGGATAPRVRGPRAEVSSGRPAQPGILGIGALCSPGPRPPPRSERAPERAARDGSRNGWGQ